MAERIRNTGVVGVGVMGFDIAFLYALKGYPTLVYDASGAVLQSSAVRVEKAIENLEKRGRISEAEVVNVRKGLKVATQIQAMAGLDLVTEAVVEVERTKQAVYEGLKECGFAGILTTNTSSLPLKALVAGGSYYPEKFATTHFFNPVLYTQMVEVVKGEMADTYFSEILSFLRSLGRNPVETQDISGFVSNSILMYYSIMALQLLESGARIEEVDGAARALGLLPPFFSFDRWRPSILEDVTRVMFEKRGDEFLRSSRSLPVFAQRNPRFYLGQEPNPEIYQCVGARSHGPDESTIKTGLKASLYAGAARVVELGENVVKVDFICVEGLKMPWPPLKEIDRIGPAVVLEDISTTGRMMLEDRLRPPQILLDMVREKQTFYKNDEANPWLCSYLERRGSHAGR
jgi:3-hydroxybutyryl-CoA dehydrogenase